MQNTSGEHGNIYADPEHAIESKVVIAGAEYSEAQLYSLAISGGLFGGNSPTIGGCAAREIDLELSGGRDIPRMAEIRVYARVVLRDLLTDEVAQAGEWLPKGVFYIDTRSADPEAGTASIHGYDAMLKAEQLYLPEGGTGEWPRSMAAVAVEIAGRMGVGIDSRTAIHPAYRMEYPNDYTMREVLGYIAAAHGANWIVTDGGRLRMVGLADIPVETSNLIEENGRAITFGGVKIRV